jgi:RHH-type transcriptional regulator, rel operon repressor / antitoxin RelB
MRETKTNVSVSFRTRKAQINQLDSLAKQQHRDRTQLIEEAIEQYLALQHIHLARIDEGIQAADRGEFATEEQIQAEFARWRKS